MTQIARTTPAEAKPIVASQLIWWLLAAALERCSCLSKSFTPTKKCLKIMSPVSMTKPYFVSECRVAGFIRTLLSGLVRSIKTSLQILSFLTLRIGWMIEQSREIREPNRASLDAKRDLY